MPLLDVAVPPGSGPGETVSFEDSYGNTLEVVVPDGVIEGESFQVEIDEGGNVNPLKALNDYVNARAESGDVMDKFVAWFERESVGEKIDRFVEVNAATIGSADASSEQSLDWWPLYQAYQGQFDVLLQEFLDEAGCSAEEFLSAADGAEGMNDMYLKVQAPAFKKRLCPARLVLAACSPGTSSAESLCGSCSLRIASTSSSSNRWAKSSESRKHSAELELHVNAFWGEFCARLTLSQRGRYRICAPWPSGPSSRPQELPLGSPRSWPGSPGPP